MAEAGAQGVGTLAVCLLLSPAWWLDIIYLGWSWGAAPRAAEASSGAALCASGRVPSWPRQTLVRGGASRENDRSWLTEGSFRSWKPDTRKENRSDSLLTAYLLSVPKNDGAGRGECWGQPWTQMPWAPSTWQCELFREQRQETALASFLLFLMFH